MIDLDRLIPPNLRRKLLSGGLLIASAMAASAGETAGCQQVEQGEGRYIACSFDPAKASITLHLRSAEGKPYGAFDPLFRELLQGGRLPVFAMNAGMYENDLSPVGLYIEKGVEQKKANTRSGWGNFHLKPNGVFYLSGGKAGVLETGDFLKKVIAPDFATQSGPMLVRGGKLHPSFLPSSDSLKTRNGVGVDAEGMVHFVISQDPVRFYDMAVLFRDRLHCANALFLDGSISSLYAPDIGRYDRWFPMGPILAVTVGWPTATIGGIHRSD